MLFVSVKFLLSIYITTGLFWKRL